MINPKEKLANTTVLVTGGAGFIGSHLCDRLLQCGAKVICFDNLSTGSKYHIAHHKGNSHFVFIKGDTHVFSDLEKVFLNYLPDYVFHFAALVGVQRTKERPLAVFDDIDGIKNIASLGAKHGVKKIIYASSSEVYGKQKELPFCESQSYHDTRNPYSLVKATGEQYFKSYYELRNLPSASLRFFNVYGPRQTFSHYGFVVGIFISQVLGGMHPTVFGDGKQTRDFTYITDAVEASIITLINEKTDGEIINIGTGVETPILQLAKEIIAISNKKLEPSFLSHIHFGETARRFADISKTKDLIGYVPRIPLDKGLAMTYKWYKENLPFINRLKQKEATFYENKDWVSLRQI